MKYLIVLAILLFALNVDCIAKGGQKDSNESESPHKPAYDIRFGDNLGGTMPLGMPACIRHLNSLSLHFNPQFASYVTVPLKHDFNIVSGLRVDRKSMRIDADAKAYYVEMVRGGEPVVGYFTGKVNLASNLWTISIPVFAGYDVSKKVSLRFGPYISFVVSRNFSGYAYNGYLRAISSLYQIDANYIYSQITSGKLSSLVPEGMDLSVLSMDDVIDFANSQLTNEQRVNLLRTVPHKYQYPTGERLEVGTSSDQRGDFDFSNDMRRVLWGLDFGVDWNLTRSVGLYADLQWGMNGIFKSSFTTVSYTMYPLYATLGIYKKL
ncbi:MAG: PorT family protein [Prevotella sp.]|nr:PorT family protein [Prevotella sp.]